MENFYDDLIIINLWNLCFIEQLPKSMKDLRPERDEYVCLEFTTCTINTGYFFKKAFSFFFFYTQ